MNEGKSNMKTLENEKVGAIFTRTDVPSCGKVLSRIGKYRESVKTPRKEIEKIIRKQGKAVKSWGKRCVLP